jgi:hypothetical protein
MGLSRSASFATIAHRCGPGSRSNSAVASHRCLCSLFFRAIERSRSGCPRTAARRLFAIGDQQHDSLDLQPALEELAQKGRYDLANKQLVGDTEHQVAVAKWS